MEYPGPKIILMSVKNFIRLVHLDTSPTTSPTLFERNPKVISPIRQKDPPCFWENCDFWVEGHTANEKTPPSKVEKVMEGGRFVW